MEISDGYASSFCIFCLKLTDDSTIDQSSSTSISDKYRFFTLIIRRFLSYSAVFSVGDQEWIRNASEVISEITTDSDDNELFFRNLRICCNCEEITKKLTDLYHQLNELELRIDCEVENLRDVMELADKMVSRTKKDDVENTYISDDDGEFRNTLKQSCQAAKEMKMIVKEEPPLNSSEDTDLQIDSEIPDLLSPISLEDYQVVPRDILVQPIQQGVLEYPTPSEFQGYSTQLETFVEELIVGHDEKQELKVEFPTYSLEITLSENDLSPLSISQLRASEPAIPMQEEDPLNPPKNSQSTYICSTSTCSLSFTSKFDLFQHNVSNHIGKYFLSVQRTDILNDQFDYYITSVLETTLNTFDKIGEKYSCHLCTDLFPRWGKARNHLVVKHRPILKEKLVELQKSEIGLWQIPEQGGSNIIITDDNANSTLKRKRGWPKEESRKSKSKGLKSNYNCADCLLPFTSKWKLFSHDSYHHPEKYFISEKFDFLTLHQFQNCVAHIISKTVGEYQKVNDKYQCNFCSQLMLKRKSIRLHTIMKHQSVLKEKIVELQKSSSINLIMNTSRRTSIGRCLSASIKTCNNYCNICGKKIKTSTLLYRHQSYLHPEIFFATSNLLKSSEKNEQFKKIVQFVLKKEVVVPVPQKGKQVKCGICAYVSSSRYSASSHLISRHQVFLAEKLKDLQKSGSVPKLDYCTGTPPLKRMKTSYDTHPVCDICEKTYKDTSTLNRHRSLYHPEMFFQNEKCTDLRNNSEGDELFSKYVRFMLERQVDQEFAQIKMTAVNLPEEDSSEQSEVSALGEGDSMKYECNFCSHALCNRKVAITHLILRHRKNMAEMLKDLDGKSVEEIKLEMMPYEVESQEYDTI